MKTIFIFICLFFTSCSDDLNIIQKDILTQTWVLKTEKYSFKNIWKSDYCEHYKLINEKWETIKLPEQIEKNNMCEDIHIISPNNNFVFFNYLNPPEKASFFLVYNLQTQKSYSIWEEDITVEAINCKWNQTGDVIACGLLDQEDYEAMTKMLIFYLDENWKLINKKEVFQKKWETMDFECGDNCEIKDFVIWENEIKYSWHNILNPLKEFNIKY